ncbi:MAG TPA: UDP-N-acetylmuramoyl-L-alanine--D-glutamate ligase [Candidatus Ornithomonoglobus intestinigallinarum]|uniref:UDP-N-acetylmuramoylalanine--D-glutamate ligase n=1 Tax=Candidatus Ornithomonoglobus intestinigallinarum TaxID=2840894 RepID=A0A9D1H2R5_9FIRM|nr:UDP-N-acetylmuramoyl-L-alanine--D-glutamate ligase [Candidatus Ornithomonoglobus intestinigallinarum]
MTALEQFEQNIKGKRVTVVGIGISNLPLIKYLVRLGADVTACDRRTKEDLGKNYTELEDLGVKFSLGGDYLKNIDAEIIFKTPGMRYDVPELVEARERGTVVTSEMEVFFDVCPAHITAVTGSDGKTTTTTLINEFLKRSGYKTWLGGNIGTPLLTRAGEMSAEDRVVLELSSFQLHTMRKSPKIAVITNISPNHLDVHKSYGEYIEAKKNIMLYQNESDILVVNADNEVTNEIGREARGTVRRFSRSDKTADYYIEDGFICRRGEKVLALDDISVPGMHNVENYMAAMAAAEGIASDESIVRTAKEFNGVEHRIEFVREINGVKYYNSSIDSSPNRTINTLRVFEGKPVILISGGKDKGIPYDEIGKPISDCVKTLILIGATTGKIEEAVKNAGGKMPEIIKKDSYEEVVKCAREIARPGDIVLLSPASTSFDMFRNFEERGNLFKELVRGL